MCPLCQSPSEAYLCHIRQPEFDNQARAFTVVLPQVGGLAILGLHGKFANDSRCNKEFPFCQKDTGVVSKRGRPTLFKIIVRTETKPPARAVPRKAHSLKRQKAPFGNSLPRLVDRVQQVLPTFCMARWQC